MGDIMTAKKATSPVIDTLPEEENNDTIISKSYKKLDNDCDIVLEKIKKRKRRKLTKQNIEIIK